MLLSIFAREGGWFRHRSRIVRGSFREGFREGCTKDARTMNERCGKLRREFIFREQTVEIRHPIEIRFFNFQNVILRPLNRSCKSSPFLANKISQISMQKSSENASEHFCARRWRGSGILRASFAHPSRKLLRRVPRRMHEGCTKVRRSFRESMKVP